jgi:hypothetical protein
MERRDATNYPRINDVLYILLGVSDIYDADNECTRFRADGHADNGAASPADEQTRVTVGAVGHHRFASLPAIPLPEAGGYTAQPSAAAWWLATVNPAESGRG